MEKATGNLVQRWSSLSGVLSAASCWLACVGGRTPLSAFHQHIRCTAVTVSMGVSCLRASSIKIRHALETFHFGNAHLSHGRPEEPSCHGVIVQQFSRRQRMTPPFTSVVDSLCLVAQWFFFRDFRALHSDRVTPTLRSGQRISLRFPHPSIKSHSSLIPLFEPEL